MKYELVWVDLSLEAPEPSIILKGKTENLTIHVSPANLASGRILSCAVDGNCVDAVIAAPADDNGIAELELTGRNNGTANVTETLDNSETCAVIHVTCVDQDAFSVMYLPASLTIV